MVYFPIRMCKVTKKSANSPIFFRLIVHLIFFNPPFVVLV